MKLFGRKLEGFPRILVGLAVVLLVSGGICGMDQVIEARHGWYFLGRWPQTPLANLLQTLDLLTFVAILLTAGGIVIVSIGWLISAVYRALSRRA